MGGIVFIAEELLTKVPRIWESLNVWITTVPKSTWSGFWFSVVIIYPEWRIARRIGMSTQMVKTQNLLGFQMLPSTESLEFRILVVLGYPFQWASVSNHLLCPHFHFYIHILSYDDIWYNICIHIQYIIYIYIYTHVHTSYRYIMGCNIFHHFARGRRGRWFFPVRTLAPRGRSLFSARGGGRTGSTGARNDLGWDELQRDDLGSSCLI